MGAVGRCEKVEIGEEKGIYVTTLLIKRKSIVFVHSSIHQDIGHDVLSSHNASLV